MLMHWRSENSASVHSKLEAVDAAEDFKVGGSSKVMIKKQVYMGEIAAMGKITIFSTSYSYTYIYLFSVSW